LKCSRRLHPGTGGDIGLIVDIFRVHYFSLDIEGPQVEKQETVPWDRVDLG